MIFIKSKRDRERPIPENVYPVIDTDLGRDNVENDMTAADLNDVAEALPEEDDDI